MAWLWIGEGGKKGVVLMWEDRMGTWNEGSGNAGFGGVKAFREIQVSGLTSDDETITYVVDERFKAILLGGVFDNSRMPFMLRSDARLLAMFHDQYEVQIPRAEKKHSTCRGARSRGLRSYCGVVAGMIVSQEQ
jgi:hypothetical protein